MFDSLYDGHEIVRAESPGALREGARRSALQFRFCFPTKSLHDFDDLRHSARAHRMASGFEAPRWIDGQLAI